jgi:hypothetical protein
MDIKNILHPILEFVFSSNSQVTLLNCIIDAPYYNILTWILLITPIVLLVIFYKVWEPLTKQLLKWFLTGMIICIILFIATRYFLIEENPCMIVLLDEYDISIPGLLNPNTFVYYVSVLISGISLILTFLYSLVIKRISKQNSHNPF